MCYRFLGSENSLDLTTWEKQMEILKGLFSIAIRLMVKAQCSIPFDADDRTVLENIRYVSKLIPTELKLQLQSSLQSR